MDDRPDLDIGPDPRLNGRGVRLDRRQRRILAVVALGIGAALVLALAGIAYGFPPGPRSAGPAVEGAAPFQVVVGGSGPAEVTVAQDGGGAVSREVRLPWSVPVDPATRGVVVEGRLLGRDGVTGIACIVRDGTGAVIQQVRDAGAGASVRCAATSG